MKNDLLKFGIWGLGILLLTGASFAVSEEDDKAVRTIDIAAIVVRIIPQVAVGGGTVGVFQAGSGVFLFEVLYRHIVGLAQGRPRIAPRVLKVGDHRDHVGADGIALAL